ncbi:uncharacterized protein EHS24_002237 [Apiotrichum porosum]|uniref:Defect at low temperature protein 1 n=1 Tax=Apiotrichum porosum TaxID=105984 RepID=A0A427XI56_9TREE|nr:uncharacterized protein EHS24_002237 [Apiotrichum porosum]RSH78512.1 hypothetical protein EHS24_002237 [Apiotrichum porosum]
MLISRLLLLLRFLSALSPAVAPILAAGWYPPVSTSLPVIFAIAAGVLSTSASVVACIALVRRRTRLDTFFEGKGVYLETLQVAERGCATPFQSAKQNIEVCHRARWTPDEVPGWGHDRRYRPPVAGGDIRDQSPAAKAGAETAAKLLQRFAENYSNPGKPWQDPRLQLPRRQGHYRQAADPLTWQARLGRRL